MQISEIFDTNLNLTWQTSGRFLLSSFKFETGQYLVQIEIKPIKFLSLKGKKTAEISFSRNDIEDGEAAHSTTSDEKIPFKVYGAVSNALMEKFDEFDAFYFIANRRHSKDDSEFEAKKRIYFSLADRLSKKIGAYFYEQKSGADEEFLVSKIRIDDHNMIIAAEEAKKAFNKNNFIAESYI